MTAAQPKKRPRFVVYKHYACYHCNALYRKGDVKCPLCGAFEARLIREIRKEES